MRAITYLLTGLFALLAAACTTTTTTTPKGPLPDVLAQPDITTISTQEDIRISPSDLLMIEVFGVDELSGEYQVDYEGNLKLPLIGEFRAQGYTANQLSNFLEAELSKDYLTDPSITVAITDTRDQIITIDGAVENPGQYNLPGGNLTLLQAVSLSGGPTSTANARRVVVFRTVGGQRMVAGFDLQAIRGGTEDDPRVYGNDVIVVDGSEVKSAYQDFLKTVPLLSLFILF